MKIDLQLPNWLKSFLEIAEEYRRMTGSILAGVLLSLIILQVYLGDISRKEVFLDLSAAILLGVYVFQVRKRRSLEWNAERLLATFRAPTTFDVIREMSELFRFRTFYSVIAVCSALILVFIAFPAASSLIVSAKPDLFLALWQVHAAFVRFFLVLLTFVFQFVNVKWVYEASLLPSMAKHTALSITLIVSLLSLLYEMFVCLLESANHSIVILRDCAVLAFAFSVLSAFFVFLKMRGFLRPESLEELLNEEVRHDLTSAIEEGQTRAVTEYLMEQECRNLSLEYSSYDFNSTLPAVVAPRSGIVRDVNLRRLRRFALKLAGSVASTGPSRPQCFIRKTIGDQLRGGIDILARVSPQDNSPETLRLLLRAYEIVEMD